MKNRKIYIIVHLAVIAIITVLGSYLISYNDPFIGFVESLLFSFNGILLIILYNIIGFILPVVIYGISFISLLTTIGYIYVLYKLELLKTGLLLTLTLSLLNVYFGFLINNSLYF